MMAMNRCWGGDLNERYVWGPWDEEGNFLKNEQQRTTLSTRATLGSVPWTQIHGGVTPPLKKNSSNSWLGCSKAACKGKASLQRTNFSEDGKGIKRLARVCKEGKAPSETVHKETQGPNG